MIDILCSDITVQNEYYKKAGSLWLPAFFIIHARERIDIRSRQIHIINMNLALTLQIKRMHECFSYHRSIL